jgi:N-carbamoylputrescine amidase
MEDLTVAAVNFRAGFGEIQENLCRMEEWTARLARQGAEIVCFPELSVCGYDHTWEIAPYLEEIPGAITDRLSEIAAAHGVYLIAGLAERAQPRQHHISQVLTGPEGLIGVYRKTHLSPEEEEFNQSGSSLPVFANPKARLGILVCHDLHFPETGTILALHGAEVLFVCLAASPRGSQSIDSMLRRLLPARAMDNSLYLITCNQVGSGRKGQEFSGAALVVDPAGKVIQRSTNTEESALLCRLRAGPLEKVRNTRETFYLAQRRPALYADLDQPLQNQYP